MKKVLIIMMSLIILVGCEKKNDSIPIVTTPVPTNEVSDTQRFIKDYSGGNIKVNVLNTDKINYLTSSQALELIKSGTGLLYIGRPTCEWCRNAVQVLLNAAREKDITINYLNPGEIDSEQITDFVKIKNLLKQQGYLNEENGNITMYLPDVYFIKEGKILDRHYSTVDSQLDASIPLDEEQFKELLNIYETNIDKIK